MSAPLNTISPLSYPSWLKYQIALAPDSAIQLYSEYLKNWYENNTLATASTTSAQIKNDYIQLLKDLNFLFNDDENDLFISQLDYTNNQEIALAIPYFVQKLKQISKILSYKRESIKKAKIRYNLAGSNNGLETLLYQYILNGFTTRENNITQVPSSSLTQFFPALSSINGNFFIELEELHDSQTYHDSDPSVPITDYVDVSSTLNDIPFEDVSEQDILGILSSRYLSRVTDTPLSRLFNQYLMEVPTLSTASLSSVAYQSIYNQIAASQKYLGETVYGLTAVRVSDIQTPDFVLNLPIAQGNNWFYWPSGTRVMDDSVFNNIYSPLELVNSNFVNCNATGGSDYTNSDLIFTDSTGSIEGAWLQGPRVEYSSDVMNVSIDAGEYREFIYPYPGFNLSRKGTSFAGYSLTDADFKIYQQLVPEQRKQILEAYFTNTLPNSAAIPIYLNNTNLVYNGATASSSSLNADVITIRSNNQQNSTIYSDALSGDTQQAFLFAQQTTDFPVLIGTNDIIWPIGSFDSSTNIPITVTQDTCLPISLGDLNVTQTMLGAVAGTTLNDSDVIYRLNSRTSEPIEAAWLGSGFIQQLSINSTINVYNASATNCAAYIDGRIQGGLSTKIESGYVSFVWADEDTYADDVVFFRQHAVDCPYYKNGPYNFYTNQDYQNPNPITNFHPWTDCRCKSVNYSPIGHAGNVFTDYNGMADYLFADPQGLGTDFAINTWQDTRGYGPLTSPQFSFYNLDGVQGDNGVGIGSGTWKTGSGDRMVLKTGRRYTYYRTPLRTGLTNTLNTPYLIINYPYKNIQGTYNVSNQIDLVILVDVSGSEFGRVQNTINVVKKFVEELQGNQTTLQIGLISFSRTSNIQSFLTVDNLSLRLAVESIPIPLTDPQNQQTDIYSALQLAYSMLETTSNNVNQLPQSVYNLCSKLNATILAGGSYGSYANVPNPNASKNILIFSDGYETMDVGGAIPYAQNLKDIGIDIASVAIGQNSYFSNVMQSIASPNSYFNLETYLNTNDGDTNAFVQKLISYYTTNPLVPTWYKAIRGTDGNWTTTYEYSDMQILPGDYLVYVHQSSTTYESGINSTFSLPSVSFAFNVKLDGWDYASSTFSPNWIGSTYGAKPFWGVSRISPDSNLDNKFYKGTLGYGGQVRFADEYVPIHQPEVSPIVLTNGNYIQYRRNSHTNLNWTQPLNFNVYLSSYQWNKIIFYEGISNLQDLFRIGNISDFIAYSSSEPSTIILQGYNQFLPNRYNYYARNPFNYTEKLYFVNKCLTSFVQFNTAVALEALQPHANLDNIHFPTIASVALPQLAVNDKQYGEYLLPEKLGVSHYRGRGYDIEVSGDTLTFIDSISAERLFLDINKYGSRNRGLTKKDQNSPVKINTIDSRWIYENYSNSSAAGTIIDTLNNQKFTPYQSRYEIIQKNELGLSRQDDDFQFWNPVYPSVWDQAGKYPLTFRQELLATSYQARQQQLLVNKGVMTNWKIDMFGNNYGLFKTPGLSANIPNVYSVSLGMLSGSAYGCGSPYASTDQVTYNPSKIQTFQFNPPVLLPTTRKS